MSNSLAGLWTILRGRYLYSVGPSKDMRRSFVAIFENGSRSCDAGTTWENPDALAFYIRYNHHIGEFYRIKGKLEEGNNG